MERKVKQQNNTLALHPVIYRGEILPDYWVTVKGEFVSTKQTLPKILSIQPGDKWNPYPKVALRINGKPKCILVHRLVCETFHKKPLPDILNEQEWSAIKPEIAEKLINFVSHADRFQVNHIDHNIDNYHADNLEWVTVIENQQKYQQHRKHSI